MHPESSPEPEMNNLRYFDLTEEERNERAKLTPKEQKAVDAFLAAAKALPRSLHIGLDDNDWGDPHLSVSKRITPGASQVVAELRKKSLCF